MEWVEKAFFNHLNKLFVISTGGNHPATNSAAYSPAKKKKPAAQSTKKTPTSPLESLPGSAFASSSTTNTEHNLAADLPSARVDPETKVEPVVPRIICEAEKEEDMATNLRVSFKERQRKHFSESIAVAHPPAKKSCAEVSCVVPVLDISLAPKPSADVVGPSHVSVIRPLIGKDGRPE